MYPKQTFSSFSIRQLSIDLGQHFASKRLGISNPRPSIPPGFKLVKIKAQTMAHSRNEYSLWKKTRIALAKSSTNVFCGAGPKQRVSGYKGSVADFFIPISRHIESRTNINSLTQCSRLSQTDKDSVIAVATAISVDAANINIEIDSTVNALNSLTQGYSPFDRRLFSHSNIFTTHLINLCARLEFPEIKGTIYPININKASKVGIRSNSPGVVIVEDFGTVLFHTSTSCKEFETAQSSTSMANLNSTFGIYHW